MTRLDTTTTQTCHASYHEGNQRSVTASSSRSGERLEGAAGYLGILGSRRWILALVSILAAALLGALIVPTIIRPSVSAETRLVVGDQTLGAQTVPGYAQATTTLAETYARFITMGTVKTSESRTLSDVQATVIPNNPVIRVQATAGNQKDALSAAAAAAQALIKSVNQVSGSTIDTSRKAFVNKLAASADADATTARLKNEIAATTTPSDKLNSEYQAAVTTSTLARIEVDAYRTIVQNQLEAGKNQSTGLTVIMQPQVLSTNKRPILLGALLGGALAVLGWGGASIIGQARRREQASPIQ
jgi:hypothetical protein